MTFLQWATKNGSRVGLPKGHSQGFARLNGDFFNAIGQER
jgi:hypothetical protein